MSKKNKKKGDDTAQLPKYQNENLIEEQAGKIKVESSEVDRLKDQLKLMSSDYRKKGEEYIKNTKSITIKLDEKIKENTYLNDEITKIRDEREEFENNCKKDFERKFEEVKAEQEAVIKKVNDEMEEVRNELDQEKLKGKNLFEENEKLKKEVIRLNNINAITIQNYENKIKEINDKHHWRLKQTTEIFENFLQNNQELLTTDLFTVYRKLKIKFENKIQECLEYKEKNEKLNEKNKMFRISMDNNDDIINECAKIQVETKKKNKNLQEEIETKDKIIENIKAQYKKQFEDLNDKFTKIVQDEDLQINSLKNELAHKDKELNEIKNLCKEYINNRSDIELFFMEQLKLARLEIIKKRKNEIERRKNFFPYLNMNNLSYNGFNESNNKDKDDSIFVTNIKKVDIKDMDPESKQKILRNLFNKLNEGKATKNYVQLKRIINI
jgi:hypothetical protein